MVRQRLETISNVLTAAPTSCLKTDAHEASGHTAVEAVAIASFPTATGTTIRRRPLTSLSPCTLSERVGDCARIKLATVFCWVKKSALGSAESGL